MKKIMTLLLALTTVIAFGQTERKFPGGGGGGLGDPIEIDDGITPKKDYCGTIQYLRPPVKSCHNPAHFDQGGNHKTSFEFEDRFGNVYCDEYFNPTNSAGRSGVPAPTIDPANTFETAHFIVEYEDLLGGMDTEIRTVINQVFADFEAFLVFNDNPCDDTAPHFTKLKYIIRNRNMPAGVIAAGSTFYDLPSWIDNRNTIFRGRTWLGINTGNPLAHRGGYDSVVVGDYYNGYAGIIYLNTNYSLSDFYTGFSSSSVDIPNTQLDLYATIQHEFIHTLGFASKLTQNGHGGGHEQINYFDTLLHFENSDSYVDTSTPYNWTANYSLTVGNIITRCGSKVHTFSSESNLFTLDSNGDWKPGSSLSHIKASCDIEVGNIMSYGALRGEYVVLSQEEVNIIHELGYKTNAYYGTTSLISTSSPNPKNHAFSSSPLNPAYALDDPCSLDNNAYTGYHINICSGNTVTIDDNFLINNVIVNDINNFDTNNIVNIEVLSNHNPFATFNTSTRILTFTPGARFVSLRYQIRDSTLGSEYISNEGLINFDITQCPTGEMDCTSPTSEICNYICNPTMDDFGLIDDIDFAIIGNYDFNNFLSDLGAYYSNYTIENWYPYFSSVVIHPRTAYYSTTIDDNNNYISQSGNDIFGIMTKLKGNIIKNTPYILSHFSTHGHTSTKIGFTNFNDTDYPVVAEDEPVLSSNYILYEDSAPYSPILNDVFEQHILSFDINSATQDSYDVLYLNGKGGFDNVSLIKDDMAIALQNNDYQTEITACDTDVILGLPLCQIDNMHYDWYNTTTGVQLSHDSNLLAGVSGYTVIGNGSQLQIDSVTESGTYKLKRSFYEELVDSEGNLLSIVENVANLEVLINVNFAPFPALGFGENNHGKIRTNIALDSQDNVFVTGSFSDPSPELVALIGDTTMVNLLQSTSYSFGAHQGFIMKLDSCGNFVTAIPYTSVHEIDIEIDSDDNIYTRDRYSLRKYDNDLNILWTISPSYSQNIIKVSDDPSFNTIIDITLNDGGSYNGRITFYNKLDGSLLNSFEFPNMNFHDVVLGNSGDIYFSGQSIGGDALYNGVSIPNQSYFLVKGNISSSGGSYSFSSQNSYISATGNFLWGKSLTFSHNNNFLVSTFSYHDIQSFDSNLNQIDSYTDTYTSHIVFNDSNNSLLVSHYIKGGGCNYLMNKLTMDTSGHFISEAWRLNDAITDPSNNHFFYNKIVIGKNDPSKIHISGEYSTDASYFNLRQSTTTGSSSLKDNYLLRLKDVGSSVEVGRVANPNIATTDTKTLRKPLVFPNPFQEELRIAITNGTQQVTGVSLSNALGSKLTISYNKTATHYTIDTAKLAKGYYYLTISYSNGTTSSTVVFK